MIAFVRENTPADFAWVPGYADYYPEAPGGPAKGRSIEPLPIDGRIPGAELAHLAPVYAAGNTSASAMGRSYAGAGATIAPAITFGYIAALDLAGAYDGEGPVAR